MTDCEKEFPKMGMETQEAFVDRCRSQWLGNCKVERKPDESNKDYRLRCRVYYEKNKGTEMKAKKEEPVAAD